MEWISLGEGKFSEREMLGNAAYHSDDAPFLLMHLYELFSYWLTYYSLSYLECMFVKISCYKSILNMMHNLQQ